MKAVEIRELSVEDLKEKIADMEQAQEKLLLTHAVSQLENPMQLRDNRKTIARLHTELNMRLKGETTEVGSTEEG
ncbi:MAG: 50S ribosomal protein L29 [Flavobacteriales bacterium]|jgi:large subunit ribosomal protein L29|nr:50S ribosomal protein L29 [Flavobacteriales bacterium]